MFNRRHFIQTSLLTTSGVIGLPLSGCGGGDPTLDLDIDNPPILVTTGTSVGTSTSARLYPDFKTSSAYKDKDYKEFIDALSLGEAIVIPGLNKTVSADGISTKMTPQGLCFAGEYILISAYDNGSSKINSVIYVISNKSSSDRQLKTVISLPTKGHVGGLAYDNENIWVCNGKEMGVIKYSEIESFASTGANNGYVSKLEKFSKVCSVLTVASFATFYNGKLFVGTFNDSAVDDMYGYEIKDRLTPTPELQDVLKMEVPEKTQGVAFRSSDGLMIASTSFGRSTDAHLRFYRPNWENPGESKGSKNFIFKRDAVKVQTIPPMSEGIVITEKYTYVLFESASHHYYGAGVFDAKNPVDRVLAFRTSDIVGS